MPLKLFAVMLSTLCAGCVSLSTVRSNLDFDDALALRNGRAVESLLRYRIFYINRRNIYIYNPQTILSYIPTRSSCINYLSNDLTVDYSSISIIHRRLAVRIIGIVGDDDTIQLTYRGISFFPYCRNQYGEVVIAYDP